MVKKQNRATWIQTVLSPTYHLWYLKLWLQCTLFRITEVVLVHFNIVNYYYQQDSSVLYTFAPNISFGQLIDISSRNYIFLTIFDSEYSYSEGWFTD